MSDDSRASIEFTPETKKLINDLARLDRFELKQPIKQVGNQYRKEVKLIFNKQQTRAEGLRWAPLSRSYAAWKTKNYPGKTLLRRTDRLYDSMTNASHADNVTQITNISGIFGTKVPYANYHDDPKSPRTKMPLRNFSIPNDRTINSMQKTLEVAIIKQFSMNGIKVERLFA